MDYTVLPATRAFIHEWNERIPAFAFPAEAGFLYGPRRHERAELVNARLYSWRFYNIFLTGMTVIFVKWVIWGVA